MKRQAKFFIHLILLAGMALALQLGAFAQAAPAPSDTPQDESASSGAPQQDPPSRVARLNFMEGSVSFQPGGEGDWVTAVPNRPLTTGDNLWADKDSRAELHVGSTSIRMSSETSITFLDLDDQTTQIRLSAGSLIVRLRHLDDGNNFEVDTPNLAFTLLQPGEYRIDVNPDGNQTVTTVWRGRGEVTGGGASYTVIAGQQAVFSGTDQLDHQIQQLPARDDFDAWSSSRDQREERAESANYISPEITGYEDLDDYGHWHYAAGYGPVWTPVSVAPGWAPYRFGHWVWVDPWGWTWVDDAPWGFAPFHYGRWAFVTGAWCWVPGPVVVRPVYAPAFVAFVGGGGFHLAIGVGGAGVGWFPLAPGEVFVPWYHVSRGYVNNVNITNTRVNVTQITNVYNVYNNNVTNTHITYVNQHVQNGVTVVSHETFVNARPVARNLERVDERQLAEAPVTHNPEIQPSRASVLGAGAPARVRPPQAIMNRPVVGTRNPTPPKAPFEQRQSAMVRTETPGHPQPAGREPAGEPRPGGAPNNARSEPPMSNNRPEPATSNNRPEPMANNRPENNPVPRPPSAVRSSQETSPASHPSQNTRIEEPERSMQRPPNPPHPLVRPAPPVQERPERQQSEQQKFQTWQAQRPSAPAPHPTKAAPAPPHSDSHQPHK